MSARTGPRPEQVRLDVAQATAQGMELIRYEVGRRTISGRATPIPLWRGGPLSSGRHRVERVAPKRFAAWWKVADLRSALEAEVECVGAVARALPSDAAGMSSRHRVAVVLEGELWDWLAARVAASQRPRSQVLREILDAARLDDEEAQP